MDLREIGWESYALGRDSHSSYGRVALAARERFLVWTEWGEVEATMSGRYRHLNTDQPCAGDWVVLRDGVVITEVLPHAQSCPGRNRAKLPVNNASGQRRLTICR